MDGRQANRDDNVSLQI